MSRITMCIEEEFSGKVIGSFDLTEYRKKVRAEVIEEFIYKFIKRTQLRQMTKKECIGAMYTIANELKEQRGE